MFSVRNSLGLGLELGLVLGLRIGLVAETQVKKNCNPSSYFIEMKIERHKFVPNTQWPG